MHLNNTPKFDKKQISGVINIKLDNKITKDNNTLHVLSAMKDFFGYGFKYCDRIPVDEKREKITFSLHNKTEFDKLLQKGELTQDLFKKIDRISSETIQENGFSLIANGFNVDLDEHIVNVCVVKFEHKKDEPLKNLKMTILEDFSIKDADFFSLYGEVVYIYRDFISKEECLNCCLKAYFENVETIEEFNDVEKAIMDSKNNIELDECFTIETDMLQDKINKLKEELGFEDISLE